MRGASSVDGPGCASSVPKVLKTRTVHGVARLHAIATSFGASFVARRTRSVCAFLKQVPGLGEHYKDRMRRWFDYRCSDFDFHTHRGDLQLDLQAIGLRSESIDVLLSPHVLEHVRDTAAALSEAYRVLRPGGRMYLQVPLQNGRTAVPTVPEFHEDNVPVCFNFGWDLTDLLRDAGFEARVLIPSGYFEMLHGRQVFPLGARGGFDLEGLVAAVRLDDLEVVMDDAQAAGLGIRPACHFSTWEAIRPRTITPRSAHRP
jgi:SAM-dependent methyltransferase